jgi:hypothetical protein
LRFATRLYPNSSEAWETLAALQEENGDWKAAADSWATVHRLAPGAGARQVAYASLERARQKQVEAMIAAAEAAAEAREFAESLRLLLDASALRPPGRLASTVRHNYFDNLGRWLAEGVFSHRPNGAWTVVGVSQIAGGSEMERYAIRDRAHAALLNGGNVEPKLLHLSKNGIESLRSGEASRLGADDWKRIEASGAEAVLVGVLGDDFQGYVFDVQRRMVHPLFTIPPIGPVLGSSARWPARDAEEGALRVEVWTDRLRYSIGEPVTVHVRVNKDSYLTLLDMRGGVKDHLLFPNSYQRENFLRANRIYNVPGPDALFSITASGPVGLERIQAVVTEAPVRIEVDRKEGPEAAVQAALERLPAGSWDISEWKFEIGAD